MKKNIKKIVNDLFYNIFSYGVSIILLQFIILPILAKNWTEEYYGTVLLLISIVTIAVALTAVTTANIRLVVNEKYKKEGFVGDFNRILGILIIVGIGILTIVFKVVLKQDIMNLILLLIYYVLYAIASYLPVGYKLNCNFKAVMVNNIILCVGYVVGLGIFFINGRWQLIYITGVGAAAIHSYFTTDIRKETFKKTPYFEDTLKRIITLDSSEIIGTGLSYFDRFCLYPILGGVAVANYQVATTFGKALNLLLTPINMVLLSYLSKKDKITKKNIYILLGFLSGLIVIFMGITKGVAKIILKILYPDYVENVIDLVMLVTLALVILVCSSMLRTFAIRYVGQKKILRNEILYSVIYVVIGLSSLLLGRGLQGFCIATLMAAIFRFFVYTISLSRFARQVEKEEIVNE